MIADQDTAEKFSLLISDGEAKSLVGGTGIYRYRVSARVRGGPRKSRAGNDPDKFSELWYSYVVRTPTL